MVRSGRVRNAKCEMHFLEFAFQEKNIGVRCQPKKKKEHRQRSKTWKGNSFLFQCGRVRFPCRHNQMPFECVEMENECVHFQRKPGKLPERVKIRNEFNGRFGKNTFKTQCVGLRVRISDSICSPNASTTVRYDYSP